MGSVVGQFTWDKTAVVFGDEAAMMHGSVEAAKMLVMAHEALAEAAKGPLKMATSSSWTRTTSTDNVTATAAEKKEEEEKAKADHRRKAVATAASAGSVGAVSDALFVSNGSMHTAGEEDDDIILYKSKSDKDNIDIVCPVLVPAAAKEDTTTDDATEKGAAGVYAAISAYCAKHRGKYKAVDVEECLSGYTKLLNLYIGMVETAVSASLSHANSRLESRCINFSKPLFHANLGTSGYALPGSKQKAGNGAKNAAVKLATIGAVQSNRKRKSVAAACEKKAKKQQQQQQQQKAQRRKAAVDVTVRGGIVVGGAPMVRSGSSFEENISSFALGMSGVGENDDDDAAFTMLAGMHDHRHIHLTQQQQQQQHTTNQHQCQRRSQAIGHVDVDKTLFLSPLMEGDTNCPSDEAAASLYAPDYTSFLDSFVNAGDTQAVSNVHSASPREAGDSPRASCTEGTVSGGSRAGAANKHEALLQSKTPDAIVVSTPPPPPTTTAMRAHQPHLTDIDASAMMAYSVLLGSSSGVGKTVIEDPVTPQSNMSKPMAATVSGGASGNGSDYFSNSSHKAAIARCLYYEENDGLERAVSTDVQNSIFSDLCLSEFHGSHSAHTMNSNVLY